MGTTWSTGGADIPILQLVALLGDLLHSCNCHWLSTLEYPTVRTHLWLPRFRSGPPDQSLCEPPRVSHEAVPPQAIAYPPSAVPRLSPWLFLIFDQAGGRSAVKTFGQCVLLSF